MSLDLRFSDERQPREDMMTLFRGLRVLPSCCCSILFKFKLKSGSNDASGTKHDLHRSCRDWLTKAASSEKFDNAIIALGPFFPQRQRPIVPFLSATNTAQHSIMSLSSRAATSLARSATRHTVPALRSSTSLVQQRGKADATDASTSHTEFKSPFHRGTGNTQDTTVIPSFKSYRNNSGEQGNKMFQYFMVGAFGGISALGAKNTVQGETCCLH